MEKLATWALAGLLAYICVVLTSIDNKIDDLGARNTQYSVLSNIKPQSFSDEDVQQIVYHEALPLRGISLQTGFMIAAILSIFVSWHVSRIYHSHQWTKRILRKSFNGFSEPYVAGKSREALHVDQDCIVDPPRPDGRIKDSWLPPRVRQIHAQWSVRKI